MSPKPPCLFAPLLILTLALLQGCAHAPVTTPQLDKQAAAFYWPYAALASNVYTTKGAIDVDTNAALASPFLRTEVRDAGSEKLAMAFIHLDRKALTERYKEQLRSECGEGALQSKDHATLLAAHCQAPQVQGSQGPQGQALPQAPRDPDDDAPVETNRLVDAAPTTLDDCNYDGGKEPSVPVHTIGSEYGWQEVPELQKYAPARRWSIFVPDLAIDVWRRPLPSAAGPSFEYAIVYRGTVGSGGLFTNFRGLAAITPAVWDQYHQAREATRFIINQVYTLHAISDAIFQRAPGARTQVSFTSVGHSLGAGLAQYVYLKIPQIDKVVGFDPSPLNGTALIPLKERQDVMARRPGRSGQPTIFMLSEYGEAVTRVAPCVPGPVWGEEGGPVVECSAVNLSRGNPMHQHNMPQLACKLYVVKMDHTPLLGNKAAQR